MRKTCKALFWPLKTIPFPRCAFLLGLLLEGLNFPCIQLLLGISQKYLVNSVEFEDPGYMRVVYILSAVILFMVLFLNPLSSYIKARSMRVFTRCFREYSVQKLLSYPYSFYEKNQTGDMITRLRDDLESIPAIYSESIFRFLLGIFYGMGSIVLMLALSRPLAILIIFLGVSETAAMAVISKKIKKNSEIIQAAAGKRNQLFFDIVSSLRFIKMASSGRLMSWKYNDIQNEYVDTGIRKNRIIQSLNLFNGLFEAANLIIILGVDILMYFMKRIDLGSVMSFLILQDGISYMIWHLTDFFSSINSRIVSCDRVFELMSQAEEEDAFNTGYQTISNGTIRIRGVSFQYHDHTVKALDHVCCQIPMGKITVVCGPSSGGKSTLVKLLLGLYPLQSGSIRIGDESYEEFQPTDLREFYAYVSQTPYLFHDTVEANIRCGNEAASMEDVTKAAELAGAHGFIAQKPDGYRTLVEGHGTNFSGGEKQRLAIARAILKKASVVILDEATSAVDWNSESYIYDTVMHMAKAGKTVVMISHRTTVFQLAEHVIQIKEGKIIEEKSGEK